MKYSEYIYLNTLSTYFDKEVNISLIKFINEILIIRMRGNASLLMQTYCN